MKRKPDEDANGNTNAKPVPILQGITGAVGSHGGLKQHLESPLIQKGVWRGVSKGVEARRLPQTNRPAGGHP
jgi:hypothetical protein